MGILKKFVGPVSKYDDTIPYTYIAKVKILDRDDDLVNHYFADTICGVIEYLAANNMPSPCISSCLNNRTLRLS